MNRILRLFVAFVFLGTAASAMADPVKAPVSAADTAAIRGVIQKQIAAFQKDDGPAAFLFATPALRERFHSADTFMRMVRESYEPVYRPAQISFGPLEEVEGAKVQHVLVVGADGLTHEALYFMEHETDGTWLIGGCMLVESKLTPT